MGAVVPTSAPSVRPRVRAPLSTRVLLLLAAVVVVDAVVATTGSDSGSGAALGRWWSSVGLGVVLVATTPVRRWPLPAVAVLAAGLGTGLAGGQPADVALATGATHALQAVVGALVLTRGGQVPARLRTQRDLVSVLTAAVACGLLAPVVPLLSESGWPGTGRLTEVVAQHAVSTLLLCPLALLGHRLRLRSVAPAELALQAGSLLAVTVLVLAPAQDLPLLFVPIPLLTWAALRLGAGVVVWELLGLAVAATAATGLGSGPVGSGDLDQHAAGAVVLGYLVSVALVTLPLTVAVEQRRGLLARVSADERLFRRSFTESPLGMVLLRDVDGDLVVDELNRAAGIVLCRHRDDVVGRALADVLVARDDAPGLAALAAGTTDSWSGAAVVVGRPGSRVELSVACLDRHDGTRTLSAQLLDVTQEHEANRRLLAAHRLNDATLDTTACLILVADAHGTVVRANAASRDITGYAEADLVGHAVWDLPLAPLTRSETEAMFVWPNRSGHPMVAERPARTADGEPLRVVWSHNVVRDDAGVPAYAVLTGIDVTAERSTTELVSHLLSASIATALVGVDARGRITLANAGASRMLGWPVAELEGRAFVDLFDRRQLLMRSGATGRHDAFVSLVGSLGDREESPTRDWTWRTRSGLDLVVSMTLSVTADLGSSSLAFLCVARDVTEQRQGQATLIDALERERTAVERLQALDRAKDEFVSTVSHELRTPVTSIIGYTEMLRDGSVVEPAPEQLPMLATISRNSERLVTICNDLLLLSGFESDATIGVRTRVDLRACVAAAADAAPTGGPDRPTLHLDPGPVAVEVTGDRGQLDRLVANLVGNAVKFTPADGLVEVRLHHDDQYAVLTVRDTGIGIPAADHEAVFQRFYRTAQAEAQAIPGTGLGLPIVAAIVAAHDGEIVLESEPGRGTTFSVALPLTDRLVAPAG